MKMSLLDMTQNILDAMTSDSVNSIEDTEESSMVAKTIREVYFYLVSKRDWPWLQYSGELEAVSDLTKPTYMKLPEDTNKVFWIKYNKKDVCYLDPKSFADLIASRTAQAGVIDSNGYVINQDPAYWTSYNDVDLIFDGYDSSVDSTLQASKTQALLVRVPGWTHEDDFIPDMPDKFFPTFLAEAKSTCFVNQKQQPNAKEEGKSRLGQNIMQKEARRNDLAEHKTNSAVDYGRTGYGNTRRRR